MESLIFVILDASGRVATEEGVEVIMEHEAAAYPFTQERINQLKEEEEEAKRNQTLKTLLVNGSRDYVISGHGKQEMYIPRLIVYIFWAILRFFLEG